MKQDLNNIFNSDDPIYAITLLLFIAPLLIIFIRRRVFTDFTYRKFAMAVNYSLICVAVITVLSLIAILVIDKKSQAAGKIETMASAITLFSAYHYAVIACVLYIPLTLLLNIPLLIQRLTGTNKKAPQKTELSK